MELLTKREAFIEETGLLLEQTGLTRMTGRILGYLFVAEKDQVSFDELVVALKASKSSISTNIRSLVQVGFVKTTSLPGDRKTYYSLSHGFSWSEIMKAKLKLTGILQKHFERAVELREKKTDKTAEWLKNGADFYQYICEEFPALLDQWEAKNKR
jgi:DNA-binding transcriptional regulator GbsR (MarR family)